MKNSIPLMLGFAFLTASSVAEDYENQIIQIQVNHQGEEVRYVMDDIEEEGATDAPMPILYGESSFQLWSLNTETAEPKLLDQTVVNGYYNPKVVIETIDAFDTEASPRTRVDVPFTVRIAGISPSYRDAAATQLSLLLNEESFPSGTFTFPAGHETNYAAARDISPLLGSMMQYPKQVSSGFADESWSSVRGAETFSVWVPATNDSPASMLSSRSIEVWPAPDADFDEGRGLNAGESYSAFDEVSIVVRNLYARDDWRLIVTDEDGVETEIQSGHVEGDEPQDRPITISNLARHLDGEGNYSLRVTQQAEGLDPTPNTLLEVSFSYDPTLRVRGNIGSGG